MEIKTVQAVVFSPCGGTLKAAGAVLLGMPQTGTVHDRTRPDQRREELKFGPEDLAVLAFPVYGGYVPSFSPEIFQELSGQKTPAVLLAVYGNREFEGALLDLDKLARERGFRPVAAAAAVAEHSMNTEIAAGRPDESDQAALADFGRRIYERLKAQNDLESFSFETPGAYPDRPAGPKLRPETESETCIDCGQCVTVCPVGAIPKDDPRVTNEPCISCMACIQVCPVAARSLQAPHLPKMMEWLKSVTAERKNPQFFF